MKKYNEKSPRTRLMESMIFLAHEYQHLKAIEIKNKRRIKNKGNQCYLYLRSATCEQDSNQLAKQEKECQTYAKHHHLKIVGVYTDKGVNGLNINRLGLNQVMKDIEKNKIQNLITLDMPRLSRDYVFYLLLSNKFEEMNLKVHFARD